MAKDYYTLLLLPENGSAIKRFTVSNTVLKALLIVLAVGVMAVSYLSYDYVQIREKSAELSQLRQLTKVQKEEIESLAAKIDGFEKAMVDIKHFDKKIRIMTNIEGGREANKYLGMGGPVPEDTIMKSHIAETEKVLIDSIHKNMDQLLEEAKCQEESFKELYDFLKKQRSLLASTPSIWPVVGWVTSEYGYRASPFTGKREFHRGLDIATKMGEDVVAPADGIISQTRKVSDMGNMIRIDHGNGISTCYGHLSKIVVKSGKRVARGEVIGQVGNSGRSTGSHLHYGVRVNGVYVDPRKYLF